MEAYKNYGDMNFFEGGLMIARDNEMDGEQYSILTCEYVNDADGAYLFSSGVIDLDDSWLDWDSIKAVAGGLEDGDNFDLVAEAYRYYGPSEFCGGTDEILTAEEVQDRMEGYAEEYEFESFPWRDGPLY